MSENCCDHVSAEVAAKDDESRAAAALPETWHGAAGNLAWRCHVSSLGDLHMHDARRF